MEFRTFLFLRFITNIRMPILGKRNDITLHMWGAPLNLGRVQPLHV